jgi:uncharacterized protein (UPF0276 family)
MRLGPSLKHALCDGYLEILRHSDICEFLVETWDPENPADVVRLLQINEKVRLLPHCITLNLLGDGPSPRSIQRVRKWIDVLGLDWISDHYCWSSFEAKASGLAIPPLVSVSECLEKVSRVRDLFGVELVLENIPTPFDEAHRVLAYHESLIACLKREGFGLLLDVENIRVDAVNSGLDPFEILKMYDGFKPKYVHVAGGGFNGILEGDSHDRACSDLTIQLLKSVPGVESLDVIYERDYALDTQEVDEEILRLRSHLSGLNRVSTARA